MDNKHNRLYSSLINTMAQIKQFCFRRNLFLSVLQAYKFLCFFLLCCKLTTQMPLCEKGLFLTLLFPVCCQSFQHYFCFFLRIQGSQELLSHKYILQPWMILDYT